ncbi:hypothetical protein JHK82_051785 [Glycine max]|uniref:Putative UPF0481 protein n=1 Tax=Glycine soja TaxID=3848 RepID=A0A445FYV8_GLYSO|nr:putative UPF0481 protein At3g02645 [Glycine soja]KAG4937555.1 hypothetical protein JHK85_052474 [Glycine max]KAG5093007.1 hypothetical protein JHK82_051785 [Glycine max]KAG5096071.1 hypothetical protein JHK84_051659 [Glycine max]KAH1200206.1 putative UPF0481 protein [Glycine max]KHN13779.1 Putative UPF0481 protein [Glycine soja]
MSYFRPTTPNASKTNFDEFRWVIQIRETLNEGHEDDDQFPVSIFNVPKPLMATDPDSYIPQQVAIGPYHYWSQELYEMERYKIASAKRFQEQLQSLKLEHMVDQLIRLEHRIRACYHRYLNFNGETLMWMMAIDASFLLEFLQVYTIHDGAMIPGVSSRMSHLMDYAGRRIAHNEILKDIVMLENQLPLFVLRKMLEFKFSSLELADDMLLSMLLGLLKELSPFKVIEKDCPEVIVSECAHLLDFLYAMIVPKLEEQTDLVQLEDQHRDKEDSEKSIVNYVKQFLGEVWRVLSKLATALISLINKVLQCRAMKIITLLPWTVISNLPGVGLIKQPVEYLFFSQDKEATEEENGNLSSENVMNKPPLMEEIAIPSVTELSKSGVCFMATNGDISTIGFDVKTVTLYLPTIGLDLNSEVLLRNLVAYEASTASGSLVFTRYTELMNGIIDSEEDAKILREKGVILNRLKSDEEVANLWNGMSKSIKLTRVPFLDKVIEDVNQHYNGRMNIKVWKFIKLYVFASWKFLTFFAAIFLLFLMSLQVFCSFYKCNRRSQVSVTK